MVKTHCLIRKNCAAVSLADLIRKSNDYPAAEEVDLDHTFGLRSLLFLINVRGDAHFWFSNISTLSVDGVLYTLILSSKSGNYVLFLAPRKSKAIENRIWPGQVDPIESIACPAKIGF